MFLSKLYVWRMQYPPLSNSVLHSRKDSFSVLQLLLHIQTPLYIKYLFIILVYALCVYNIFLIMPNTRLIVVKKTAVIVELSSAILNNR